MKSGNNDSPCLQLPPFPFQPIPQLRRRKAIVRVVPLHRLPLSLRQLLVSPTQLQPVLHIPHRRPRRFQRNLPLESAKCLQLLQRIFLHARTHSLLERLMQIHQHPRSQHPVDFVFPRRVHPHQSLQGSRLVPAEVIRVHFRICFPPPHDFVHQPFKSLRFSYFNSPGTSSTTNPKRYCNPFSPTNGSPSKSTNMSPTEGSGSRLNPIPSATCKSTSYFSLFSVRPSTCIRACSRTRSNPALTPCFGLSLSGIGSAASFAIVSAFHVSNWSRCCLRIPATSDK